MDFHILGEVASNFRVVAGRRYSAEEKSSGEGGMLVLFLSYSTHRAIKAAAP